MIESKFSVQNLVENLRISETSVRLLLRKNNFDADASNGLTAGQTAEFVNIIEQNSDLAERRSQENLENVAHRFTIIVDTSTLLNDNFPAFYQRMEPLLKREGKRFVIPTGVVTEIKDMLFKSESREKASNAFRLLIAGEKAGVIEVCSNESGPILNQQILTIASKLFMQQDVLLITTNKALSVDALHLNHLESIKGHKMGVSMVNSHGYLSRFFPSYMRS